MNRDFIYARLNDHIPGEQKVALCRVAEEAAELTKEAMKALRFGINNRHPIDGPTNAEKIVAEFYDVQEALVDAGLIAPCAKLERNKARRWGPPDAHGVCRARR